MNMTGTAGGRSGIARQHSPGGNGWMGFNASQFVVGDEWVYRLRDDAASERVRILGVMPKKRSAKVDVEFVDDPDGRVETVPGSRLRVLWSELESYEALMADWGRIASPVLDQVEEACAEMVFRLLIPTNVAEIEWSPVSCDCYPRLGETRGDHRWSARRGSGGFRVV
jgi:hypothetical protein